MIREARNAIAPADQVCCRGLQPRHDLSRDSSKQRLGMTKKKRPALRRPLFLRTRELSLLGSDLVLCGLGHAEFHYGLGFDLDGFAGLRIAAHAGFALGLYQAAESGNHEQTALLGFLERRISEVLQECCRLLVVDFEFIGHIADESCLCHALCHESLLSVVGWMGVRIELLSYRTRSEKKSDFASIHAGFCIFSRNTMR